MVTSAGAPWESIAVEKNRVAAFTSRLVETIPSMPARAVDGAIHIPPGAGHLHVGLIYEPAVPDGVAAWPGSVEDQGGEALHPPVQGDVVNLDAALS